MSASKFPLWAKILALTLIATVFTWLYWRSAVRQMIEVNVDSGVTDQGAYIDYARQLYASSFSYSGDFNRMPLYPALQAIFLRSEMNRREIFEQGKQLNLYLPLPLLAGIALLFGRRFSGLHTLNLMLVTGFMVFIFKAGWFQAELLFYFLNFCLFLEMASLFKRPSFGLAVLAGITGCTSGMPRLQPATAWCWPNSCR